MKLASKKLPWVLILVCAALTMTACQSTAKDAGSGDAYATDAISAATEKSDSDSKIKVVWEALSEEVIANLFKDDTQTGVFIWSNQNENLVVGDPSKLPIPFVWPQERSVVSSKTLGYALVKAEPKALIDVKPDYILLIMPKSDEARLEEVGLELKDALAGKALATVKRNRFYVWFYEPKAE